MGTRGLGVVYEEPEENDTGPELIGTMEDTSIDAEACTMCDSTSRQPSL